MNTISPNEIKILIAHRVAKRLRQLSIFSTPNMATSFGNVYVRFWNGKNNESFNVAVIDRSEEETVLDLIETRENIDEILSNSISSLTSREKAELIIHLADLKRKEEK